MIGIILFLSRKDSKQTQNSASEMEYKRRREINRRDHAIVVLSPCKWTDFKICSHGLKMQEIEIQNEIARLKKEVLENALRAYREKMIVGTSGNISAYYAEKNWVVITPSSYDYNIMEEKDIVVIDLDGAVVEGHLKPSSEWKMHAEIYKHIPHIKGIVHTHSPYATSFAVLQKEIPVILIEMIPFIKGSLEVSAYAEQGSAEVGLNAVPILKDKNACLMANHGVIAVGEDLNKAYMHSAYAEDIAKVYHMALSVGKPVVIG